MLLCVDVDTRKKLKKEGENNSITLKLETAQAKLMVVWKVNLQCFYMGLKWNDTFCILYKYFFLQGPNSIDFQKNRRFKILRTFFLCLCQSGKKMYFIIALYFDAIPVTASVLDRYTLYLYFPCFLLQWKGDMHVVKKHTYTFFFKCKVIAILFIAMPYLFLYHTQRNIFFQCFQDPFRSESKSGNYHWNGMVFDLGGKGLNGSMCEINNSIL